MNADEMTFEEFVQHARDLVRRQVGRTERDKLCSRCSPALVIPPGEPPGPFCKTYLQGAPLWKLLVLAEEIAELFPAEDPGKSSEPQRHPSGEVRYQSQSGETP